MKIVPWIVAFISVLGTEAWFLWPGSSWKFEWEPLLAFIVALGAFITFERKAYIKSDIPQASKSDIELFQSLQKPFELSGLNFFRNHDFGGPYLKKEAEPLDRLIKLNSFGVELEFVDPDLEILRKKLFQTASNLSSLLATHSFYLDGHPDALRVYPDLTFEDRRKKEAISSINHASNEFVFAYEELYKAARKKLTT